MTPKRPGLLLLLSMLLSSAQVASAFAAPPVVPRGVRAEGVSAVVGDGKRTAATFVLHSDVDLRARLSLMSEMSSDRMPLGPLPQELLGPILDQIVGEVLIAREAQRVRIKKPKATTIRAERRRIADQVGGESRLRRLLKAVDADPDEIDQLATRRAWVSGFLRANLSGATQVSEEDVLRAFESQEHPFVGQELDDVRELMRVWLKNQLLAQTVLRWVRVLRARSFVSIVARYGRTDD